MDKQFLSSPNSNLAFDRVSGRFYSNSESILNEEKLNLGEKQSNRNQSLKYGFKTVCESLKASKLRRKEITISEDTIDLNKICSDGIFDFNMEVKLTNFSLDAAENTNNLVTYSFEEIFYVFKQKILAEENIENILRQLYEKTPPLQISNLILRTCAFFLLKRKNWTLKTGAKYGCDFMAYEGSELKFHSKFGVLVFDCEKKSFKKIMRVQRILTSVKKEFVGITWSRKLDIETFDDLSSYLDDLKTEDFSIFSLDYSQ